MPQATKPIRRNAKQAPAPKFFDPATIDTRFYGHLLTGHCLDPEFKEGDKVVFDREAQLENGCFACFYYRPELVRPGHLSVALKKLVIAPGNHPHVREVRRLFGGSCDQAFRRHGQAPLHPLRYGLRPINNARGGELVARNHAAHIQRLSKNTTGANSIACGRPVAAYRAVHQALRLDVPSRRPGRAAMHTMSQSCVAKAVLTRIKKT